MKFIKKTISTALAVAMAVTSFSGLTSAFAAEEPSINLDYDKQVIAPGEALTINLKSDTDYTTGFGTLFRWEAASIQSYTDEVKVTNTIAGLTGLLNTNIGYVINFGVTSYAQFRADEPLASIVIDTADNIPEGKYTLPLDKIDIRDTSMAPVKFKSENITFTVKDDGSDNEPTTEPSGDPSSPTQNPSETIDPNKPSQSPDATIEPSIPTQKPSETVKPEETIKPNQPTQKPSETEKPINPTQKPSETEKPSQPTPTSIPGEENPPVDKPDGNYSYRITVFNNDGYIPGTIVSVNRETGDVTVKLPSGYELTTANRTNVQVNMRDSGSPVRGVIVTVTAQTGNILAAEDVTNRRGIATVPVVDSDLTDKNGDSEVEGDKIDPDTGDVVDKSQYKVHVENANGPIENAEVKTDNGDVFVVLPNGAELDYDNRTTVTVTDENNAPKQGTSVTVSDANGNTEKGLTDANGQIVVPPLNEDVTDQNGSANVDRTTTDSEGNTTTQKYIVYVTNEQGIVNNAFVSVDNETGNISVLLPDGVIIDYANKTTVTVTDSDNNPVTGLNVTVSDKVGMSLSDVTDNLGQITVPPMSEDFTDVEGEGYVEKKDVNPEDPTGSTFITTGYNVSVANEEGPIPEAFVKIDKETGKISVVLPTGKVIDYNNRTTVTVTEVAGTPANNVVVSVTDETNTSITDATNSLGQVVVPPANKDITDNNGKGNVTQNNGEENQKKNDVTVSDSNGPIEGAIVETDDTTGDITVTLPDGKTLTPDNPVKVEVKDENGNPVKDKNVTVKDAQGNEGSDLTNSYGIAKVPPTAEDDTDSKGKADVTETDSEGVKKDYNVFVENNDGAIENAHIKVENGKLTVTLPDTHVLITSNKTTVTVTDNNNNPVTGMSVAISDHNNKSASGTTNTEGKVTLPRTSSSGGSTGGGGGGSISTTSSTTVTVTDKNGETVSGVTKSVKGNEVTLTLPNGKVLDDENWYSVTITDSKGNPKEDVKVTMKDKTGKTEETGTTDEKGKVRLPAMPTSTHKAYVVGYEDGTFLPDGLMTRAEAAVIFAKNVAEAKNESFPTNRISSFTDVPLDSWYATAVTYLEKYDIIAGYGDGTFMPNEKVTRAEFITMCASFYKIVNNDIKSNSKNSFNDVADNHWAAKFIKNATAMGWIKGYDDGTFRPDNNITRAEVVTIVNRMLGRVADTEFISSHPSSITKFIDVKTTKSHWAYYDIVEAANDHTAVDTDGQEEWVE